MPGTNTQAVDDENISSGGKKANDHDNHGAGDDGSDDAARASAAEATATKRGWVPKEDFTGDPSKWVDAATFVERGNNFASNLQKELRSVKAELANFKGTAEAFKKFHKEAMDGKQKELDSAMKQLKAQHREAIRDGDDDAADALEGRMDVIQKAKTDLTKELEVQPKEEAPAPGLTPELKAWVEEGDNGWFETDIPMQKYALAIAEELVKNGETLRGRPFLDKVAAQVRADFPAKFGNARRNRPGSAEGGSGAVKTGPGRTAKDLPDEDRELMKQFVKEGWTTEEKFLKDYRW